MNRANRDSLFNPRNSISRSFNRFPSNYRFDGRRRILEIEIIFFLLFFFFFEIKLLDYSVPRIRIDSKIPNLVELF